MNIFKKIFNKLKDRSSTKKIEALDNTQLLDNLPKRERSEVMALDFLNNIKEFENSIMSVKKEIDQKDLDPAPFDFAMMRLEYTTHARSRSIPSGSS